MTLPTLSASVKIADQQYRVLGYRLSQALDAIDIVSCEIDGSLFTLEPASSFVGQPAEFRLTVEGTDEHELFLGDVTRASDSIEDDGVRVVSLAIASPLWKLDQRAQSQIYQNETIAAIVEAELSDAGITTAVAWHGQAHLTQLAYVVQFEESDFEFVTRLLAEHGISFGYEVDQGKPRLWFSDDPSKRQEDAAKTLIFRTAFGHDAAADSVFELGQIQQLRPDAAVVSAYDPRHCGLAIEGKSDSGTHSSEIYAPLSRAQAPDRAQSVAERVVTSYQSRSRIVRGLSASTNLRPGLVIEISGHPYPPLNGKYLLESVRSVGQRAREFSTTERERLRSVEFVAVPSDVRRVPERRPDARIVHGVQSAITTGPSGDEIHTNEYGEVTVHAPWDRKGKKDETSSRFMRTSQVPTGGSMLLPRVGWEVLVAHHEGDVDQPIVMSRLYNAETMPPYPLPEGALKSSLQTGTSPGDGTSNEIRMDDTKGNEQMFFNASRDLSLQVGNNTTQNVGNDLKVEVGAHQKQTVIGSVKSTVGANQKLEVSGDQNVSVESLEVEQIEGAHSAVISGNRVQMIGGDHRRTVEGKSQLEVTGSSMSAVIGSVTMETEDSYKHDVGAVLVQVTGGSRSVTVGGAHSETTGGAKILVAGGTRSLEVGSLAEQVGGAIVAQIKGDRSDSADGGWIETAGGQQKIEANNVSIEGTREIKLQMGGASITLTPAMVSISGANIKLDGDLIEVAPMIIDN